MTQVKDRLPSLLADSDEELKKTKDALQRKLDSAQSSRRRDKEEVSCRPCVLGRVEGLRIWDLGFGSRAHCSCLMV